MKKVEVRGKDKESRRKKGRRERRNANASETGMREGEKGEGENTSEPVQRLALAQMHFERLFKFPIHRKGKVHFRYFPTTPKKSTDKI